jgi:hypothetical protein
MAARCQTSDPTLKVHDLESCDAERSHQYMQGPNIPESCVQGCLVEFLVSCRELDRSQIREGHGTVMELISQEGSISAVNLGLQTEKDSEGILQ